jgi:glycosyltransferase involved in cell wall biosynthesis
MAGPHWHILTGEYPPQPGGVSDYTRLVAEGLAARGCTVDVWTTTAEGETPLARCVTVHREPAIWSGAGLARLGAKLGPPGGGRRLLVQYTPNAWGGKSVNLGFCRWLAARGRGGDAVRVMFHELFHYTRLRERPTRWLLPVVHRAMLRRVLEGCSHVDYSTGEWGRLLAHFPTAREKMTTWMPVPSTIPVVDDAAGVVALRRQIAPEGEAIIGSFGTYGEDLRQRLGAVFPRLVLAQSDRVGLLIGRGGDRFAAQLISAHPRLRGRLVAPGSLDPAGVSRHLQICTVLVQPYPDGLCARRTTAMAAFVHGLPVASNAGSFTEAEMASDCAALAQADSPESLVCVAESLLGDTEKRARLGASARRVYERHFALERTIEVLLESHVSDAGR